MNMVEEESNMANVSKIHEEIEELKEKVKELGEDSTEDYARALGKLHRQLHDKADELMEVYGSLLSKYRESGKDAMRGVGAKVAERPVASLLLAFGAGLVIGHICRCGCRHRHGE